MGLKRFFVLTPRTFVFSHHPHPLLLTQAEYLCEGFLISRIAWPYPGTVLTKFLRHQAESQFSFSHFRPYWKNN